VLILTKPLGTGIVVRARKYGQGSDEELAAAVASMIDLNDRAARALAAMPAGAVTSCTDVTGFGLAGHASEVASASGVVLEIDSERLPVLPGAERLAAEYLPCGGRANRRHFVRMNVGPGVRPERHLICLDPQTSGGLLITVNDQDAGAMMGYFTEQGVSAVAIGRVAPSDQSDTLLRLI
jgi:selenide,water dikinase